MSNATQDILKSAIHSPFPRLRALLDGIPPGIEPAIDMTIGEPRHAMPEFLGAELAKALPGFAKYPPIQGSPDLRQAIAVWLERRYDLKGKVGPDKHVTALCGSREGLFSAIFPAIDRKPVHANPAALIPNPFYQAYLAAALAARAEPVMLPCRAETHFLPDLGWLSQQTELLTRAACFFLCSPANPQGTVASAEYWGKAIALCRQHDIMLFADECYSEIYDVTPPPGALEASGTDFKNVISFNSLSKRSNLPGLRSGFAAGDADFIARLTQFRNVAGPQLPGPLQAASAAIWRDEGHVAKSRDIYRQKFKLVREIFGNRGGHLAPEGGFFLWLEMKHLGGSEKAAVTIWQRTGVKVLPGAYLSYAVAGTADPGRDYVRAALVHDLATTETALHRLASVLE